MRVLFIYSNQATYMPPHYQHGIGSLSAVLKVHGHTTGLKVYERPVEREALIKDIKSFSPGLVAFSTATNQYKYAREYSTWIKESLDAPIVVGGVHPTLDPENTIRHPAWDFMVVGEGEEALLELVQALEEGRDPSGIPNLWGRRDGDIFRNETRPLNENLDDLPFSDREIFDYEHLLRGERGAMAILAARGCPYACAYCCNPALRRLYGKKGKWVRRRNASNILAEIEALKKNYPIKFLYFDDDVFTLEKEWMLDFLKRYKREAALPFRVNVRVETVDREMLAALKDAGCEMIQVGVEHGDEEFRRKVLRRPMSDERIVNVFKWADEVGLKTWSFNIIGFPGETPELARKTIALNEKIRPDHLQVSVFNPYPGTGLYDECVEKGYLGTDVDPSDGFFNPETKLKLDTISEDELKSLHREMLELSERIEDERRIKRRYSGRKILFDLAAMLGEASVEQPAEGYVKIDYYSIDDDVRKTLQEHPSSKIVYRLKIPAGATFEFAVAIHPDVWEKAAGDGVVFRIEATVRKIVGKSITREIFRHHLDPKRSPGDRKWHEFSVDLNEFAGKTVDLALITGMLNDSESSYNTAGWGNPLIVESQKAGG